MPENTQNPLAKHFRQPAIYTPIPSKGRFWPDGDIDIPVNGEIAVYPMTTKDELSLRTPDALMNGAGMVEVIQSCCPSIKNAWNMPTIDVDAILISIRIASYGHEMDVDANCPECKEANRYSIDLRTVLASIQPVDYDTPEEINGLKFFLKPQTFKNSNDIGNITFEEQKIMQTLSNENIADEDKARIVATQLKRMTNMTDDILTSGTRCIVTEEGIEVSNPEHMKEFYQNADSKIVRILQKRLEKIADESSIKPHQVKCTSCNHEFTMKIDFNFSSFFAVGF